MPSRPPRICNRCRATVPAHQPCPTCSAEYVDATHAERSAPYSTKGHKAFRLAVLARDPLCVLCHVAVADRADHYPRTRRQLLADGADPDDPRYGRGLCQRCHNRHTARSPGGGWGTRPRT